MRMVVCAHTPMEKPRIKKEHLKPSDWDFRGFFGPIRKEGLATTREFMAKASLL